MVQVLYTGDVTVSGGRNGHAESSDGKLSLDLSAPKSLGGDNGAGTNPEQLFAAAHAACFGGAMEYQARLQGIPLGDFTVCAEVGVGPQDTGVFGLTESLTVTIRGMDQQVADKLVGDADRNCPYSNALRGNVEMKLIVKTA